METCPDSTDLTRMVDSVKACTENLKKILSYSDCENRSNKLLHKTEFEDLASRYVKNVAKMKHLEILDSMPQEEWPVVAPKEIEDEFDAAKNECKEIKDSYEEQREKLLELTKFVEEKYDNLLLKIQMLEEKYQEYLDKKDDMQKVKYRYEMEIQGFNSGDSARHCELTKILTSVLETRLVTVSEKIDKLETMMVEYRAEIESLKKSTDVLLSQIIDIKVKLSQNEDARIKAKENAEKPIKELEEIVELLNRIGGFREHSIDGTTITIQYLPQNQSYDDSMFLNMHFKLTGEEDFVLESAEVSCEGLDVKSIIEEAVENDDVTYCVQEIKKIWEEYCCLGGEITELQNRFAIDWIHSEHQLRVVLGYSANIVCTLFVPDGYPQTHQVSLLSIEGGITVDKSSLQPPQDKPTLTDWLEYLHTEFNDK